MTEKLNFRIAEWTGWAMGRVLDWINYLDVDLKEANLEDWEDRDVQRHQLADEVAELEEKLDSPTCHRGHSDYSLTLWDCPVCVGIEKSKLETRLEAAAEKAFISEFIETEMLDHYMKSLPGVSADQFKSDWKEGWIDALIEEGK